MKLGGKKAQEKAVPTTNIHAGKPLWLGVVFPLALGTFFLGVAFEMYLGTFTRFLIQPVQQTLEVEKVSFDAAQVIVPVEEVTAADERPQDTAPHLVIAPGSGTRPIFNEPSLEGRIVTEVHAGEEYPYTRMVGEWYQFYFEDDMTAWIQAIYVAPLQ